MSHQIQKSVVKKYRKFAALFVSALVVNAGGVLAQKAKAQATRQRANETIEEVVVTGSHITSKQFTGRVPVSVLDEEALGKFSANQLGDILEEIPSNIGSVSTDESGLLAGAGQFNIRGLGLASTLTLINGRRGGVAPFADSSGADFTDINQFPLAMVKRVEILKDGASAVYGSEAVSGVANIITRKGFEGFEVSMDYEDASNDAYSFNLATGKQFDGATFNMYATYYHQDRNNRADLDYLVERLNGGGVPGRSRLLSATGNPGTYNRATFDGDGNPTMLDGAVPFADPDCLEAGGFFRINDDGSTDTSTCRHLFFDQVSPVPEIDRFQAFVEFDMQLNDKVSYYNEISFSRNEVREDNGPQPGLQGAVTGNGAGQVFIPADHPFNFFIEDPADPTALVYIDPEDWDNAIHTAVPLTAQMRPLGRELHQTGLEKWDIRRDVDYLRMVNGFGFDLSDTWTGDASYMYASAHMTNITPLIWRSDIFNQLVLDGDWNPFGTRETDPTLVSPKDGVSVSGNGNLIDQIYTDDTQDVTSSQHVIDLVFSGDLMELSSGPVSAAVGAQHRSLKIVDTPQPFNGSGGGLTPSLSTTVRGEESVYSLFGEVIIPLSSIAELQLALRYEDYGDFGDSTDPKAALSVAPTDWLTLRGSWGTAFQAPRIRQVAVQTNVEFVDDPASAGPGPQNAVCVDTGINQGVFTVKSGSPDLTAQTSTNFTLGAIFSFANGVDFSADYWHYNYEDLISPEASAQAIVNNDCLDDGIPNDPRIIRDGSGQLLEIASFFINVGEVETDGVDLSLAYEFPVGDVGFFTLRGDASYINKFDVVEPDGSTFSGLGSRNFSNGFNTIPQLRATSSLSWINGIHSANISLRYIDGYDNDQSGNAPVDSMTTVGLQYGIDLAELFGSTSTQFILGVDNVFDEDPPGLRTSAPANSIEAYDRPGYDPRSGADLRGRIMYARMVYSF